LSRGDSLQDTLRLLTLWFNFGYEHHVNTAMQAGFGTVSIDVWLEVIPQVSDHRNIARDGRVHSG
jgi:FKBP12-rapamycin complex-associated protein